MFDLVSGRSDLSGLQVQPLAAYVSGNVVQVSFEHHGSAKATAEVVAVAHNNQIGVFMHFYLVNGGQGVLMRYNMSVTQGNLANVIEQALDYMAAMGFLMEQKAFSKDAPATIKQLVHSLSVFGNIPKVAERDTGYVAHEEVGEAVIASVLLDESPPTGNQDVSVAMVMEEVQEAAREPSVNIQIENWQVWVKYLASF